MNSLAQLLKKFWHHIGSLKLTVGLMAAATLLVFVATLDQVNFGIRHAQERYIEAWVGPWPFVIPGGYLLGVLSLINLIAAHPRYFKKFQFGILCIHLGVGLLIVSSFAAGVGHREGQMWVSEGHKGNVVETTTENELVILEHIEGGRQKIWRVAQKDLRDGAEFEGLPVGVKILKLLPNASIGPREKNLTLVRDNDALIVDGYGRKLWTRSQLKAPQGYLRDSDWVVFDQAPTYRENSVNALTALVEVEGVGEFLLSNLLGESFMPQQLSLRGKTYEIALRLKRTTLPFEVRLEDFRFDRYIGSDIPKNFSSEVTVLDGSESRKALISMNNPLRYGGYTFYQASFDQASEGATMLLVVQNYAASLPYIAVAMVTLGLCWHMGKRFFGKKGNS